MALQPWLRTAGHQLRIQAGAMFKCKHTYRACSSETAEMLGKLVHVMLHLIGFSGPKGQIGRLLKRGCRRRANSLSVASHGRARETDRELRIIGRCSRLTNQIVATSGAKLALVAYLILRCCRPKSGSGADGRGASPAPTAAAIGS